MEYINNLDTQTLLYIQEHIRTDLLSSILIPFTHLGDKGILWILTSLILMCFKKTRKIGLICGLSLFIGAIITNVMLKNIVARTRPFYAINDLIALISYPKDYSFPSGHSTSWFAGGFSMFLTINKKISFIFLILATCMGFSRLYVGVHYPTDVISGIIIGIVSALISYYTIKIIYKHYNQKNHTIIDEKG